jgi:hypothetical protein
LRTFARLIRFGASLPAHEAYLACITSSLTTIAEQHRIQLCGTRAFVSYSPSQQKYRVQSARCHMKICPQCRLAYARSLYDKILAILTDQRPADFQLVTLTLLHSHAPLKLQLQHLRASFRRLRQSRVWHHHVDYGIAVIETTFNVAKHEWHPHLHILAHTRWIPWHDLRSAWIAASRGAMIIDSQTVKNATHAAHYLSAYLAKPPSDSVATDPTLASDYYAALKKSRWIIQFGRKKMPKVNVYVPPDPLDWISLGSLDSLVESANRGESSARQHVLRLLAQLRPELLRHPVLPPDYAHALHCIPPHPPPDSLPTSHRD